MTYVSEILAQMTDVFKPQQKAILALLSALMCFSGRATMRNLSRYGAGSPKRLRRWASQEFGYLNFNLRLLDKHQVIINDPQPMVDKPKRLNQAILIDATFLRKSGGNTEGLGWFHNGSSRSTQKLEPGLEMTLIAAVNMDEHSAYALSAHQSLDQSALELACDQLSKQSDRLQEISKYVVADGYYARERFVSTTLENGFELVTLLRRDAALRYLYAGDYQGKGRPKRYAGRVDYEDLSSWELHRAVRDGFKIYSRIVNYPAWGRDLLIVIKVDRSGHRRILCSTDLTLSVTQVLELYELRFQIEFLFRDAKQHTGLGHAQTLDSHGQEHFANASLCAVNLLRLEARSIVLERGLAPRNMVTSVRSLKVRKYNQLVIKNFLSCLGLTQDQQIYFAVLDEVAQTGIRAA